MQSRKDRVLWGAALLLLLTGAVGVVESASWLGRPFPGFLVLENRVVASAGLSSWPAVASGEIYQHEIVSIEGRPLLAIEELERTVSSVPVGTMLEYEFRQGDRQLKRSIATRRFGADDYLWLFGAYLLCGITFSGSALLIRRLRGADTLGNGTFPVLWLTGMFVFSAMDLYGPYRLFRLNALCETLLAAGMIHMALVFPHPVRLAERRPWLLAAPYLVAVPFALVTQLGLMSPSSYVVTHLIASSAFGSALLVLVGSLVGRYLRPPSFEARQRVKVLAFGTALVMTPPALFSLAAVFTGGQENWSLIALTSSLFPMFIGYAVLRHDLLEIDVVVRRSLGYAVLTLAVTLLYAGTASATEVLFRGSSHLGPLSAGVVVICAMVLLPARDRAQSLVDRVFFRSAYDFRRVVQTTSQRLASVAELSVIADQFEQAVGDMLHPEWLALFVRQGEEAEEALTLLRRRGDGAPSAPEHEAEAAASEAPLDLAGGGLAVPFRAEGRLVGLLLLGRRLSGGYYGADDRRLLQTLANQGAIAMENARAIEQVRELNRNLEAKVEERTVDLVEAMRELRETQAQLIHTEKMASLGQFVAGIAHEINNPLAFIQGNLHFIRNYTDSLGQVLAAYEEAMAGQPELSERVEELKRAHDTGFLLQDMASVLDGVTEGVERTTALVKDLRTFSRIDDADLIEIDLHEALDSTLNLLQSSLTGVEIVRKYGELPKIECLGGPINQVLMNLLANAVDALGGRGILTIRTARVGEDRIEVEVADDGCGIEPDKLNRIFDPFFTTKEVGKGTGLGLSISYGIVTRHNGAISVESEPGRGSCFRVELPTRALLAEGAQDPPKA